MWVTHFSCWFSILFLQYHDKRYAWNGISGICTPGQQLGLGLLGQGISRQKPIQFSRRNLEGKSRGPNGPFFLSYITFSQILPEQEVFNQSLYSQWPETLTDTHVWDPKKVCSTENCIQFCRFKQKINWIRIEFPKDQNFFSIQNRQFLKLARFIRLRTWATLWYRKEHSSQMLI